MRDNQIHAPYNFVSFPNKVIRRYARPEDVPRQDRWDEDLLSGEIAVTLTARTPVFLSDGAKDDRGRGDRHFVRDAGGRCVIPGSSLRGLVRENMQILGCGLVRPSVDDHRLQQIGEACLYPARVAAEGLEELLVEAALKALLVIVLKQPGQMDLPAIPPGPGPGSVLVGAAALAVGQKILHAGGGRARSHRP